MRKTLFTAVAAAMLLTGSAYAAEQTTTTTTTWTNQHGEMIREYSTTKHSKSFDDSKFHATVGVTVPAQAELYPLPESISVPDSKKYSYVVINGEPAVVETTTRRVIHVW